MPQCPRCSKRFKNNTAILQHMNQPTGRCYNHAEELAEFSDLFQDDDRPLKRRRLSTQKPEDFTDFDYDMEENFDQDDPFEGQQYGMAETSPASLDPRLGPFVEQYPGAAETYGRAETFMDRFNADTYAGERVHNLYYPFASRQELQVASFLLRSKLSMSDIDEYLSLEMVSIHPWM
jgi:hypothetical protein